MSTATEENSIADAMEVLRYTKIYDEHGKHISTRDSCTGIEWPTLADDEEVQPTPAASETKKRRCFIGTAFRTRKARSSRRFYISSLSISHTQTLKAVAQSPLLSLSPASLARSFAHGLRMTRKAI